MLLPLYVFTLVFIVGPLVYMVILSFLQRAETWGVTNQFTLDNYRNILEPVYLQTFVESFKLAIISTVLIILIGYPFGYFMAKLTAKWKKRTMMLLMIPFWTSSLIRLYGWIIIFRANGVFDKLLMGLGITDEPMRLLYTYPAVVVGMIYALLPFMIFAVYSSAEKLDWSLIELFGGARPRRLAHQGIFHRHAEADAARPAFGRRSHVHPVDGPVLHRGHSRRQQGCARRQPDPGPADEGAQLAVRRGARRDPDDPHERDDRPVPEDLRRQGSRRPRVSGQKGMGEALKNRTHLPNVYLGVILLLMYVPIVLVIIYSFNESKISSVWDGFSLKWYEELFRDRALFESLLNSIILGVSSSCAAAVIGTLGAVGSSKVQLRGKGIMEYISTLPLMIPEIILGMVFMVFFSLIGLPFGMTTLIIAHTAFCIPYVFMLVKARLVGLDKSLEEAALDLGASKVRAFFDIVLPLIAPAIASGMLLAFAMSFDDVIISFFVTGVDSNTLPLKIYSQLKTGVTPEINALCTLIFLVTISLCGLAIFLGREKKPKTPKETTEI